MLLLLSPKETWPWNIQGEMGWLLFLDVAAELKILDLMTPTPQLWVPQEWRASCVHHIGWRMFTALQAEDAHLSCIGHYAKQVCKFTVPQKWRLGVSAPRSDSSPVLHTLLAEFLWSHTMQDICQPRTGKPRLTFQDSLGLWQDSQQLKMGFAAWRSQWTDLQAGYEVSEWYFRTWN